MEKSILEHLLEKSKTEHGHAASLTSADSASSSEANTPAGDNEQTSNRRTTSPSVSKLEAGQSRQEKAEHSSILFASKSQDSVVRIDNPIESIYSLAKDLKEEDLVTTLKHLIQLYLSKKDETLLKFVPVDFMDLILNVIQMMHKAKKDNVFYYIAKYLSDLDLESDNMQDFMSLSLNQIVDNAKEKIAVETPSEACQIRIDDSYTVLDDSIMQKKPEDQDPAKSRNIGTAESSDPMVVNTEKLVSLQFEDMDFSEPSVDQGEEEPSLLHGDQVESKGINDNKEEQHIELKEVHDASEATNIEKKGISGTAPAESDNTKKSREESNISSQGTTMKSSDTLRQLLTFDKTSLKSDRAVTQQNVGLLQPDVLQPNKGLPQPKSALLQQKSAQVQPNKGFPQSDSTVVQCQRADQQSDVASFDVLRQLLTLDKAALKPDSAEVQTDSLVLQTTKGFPLTNSATVQRQSVEVQAGKGLSKLHSGVVQSHSATMQMRSAVLQPEKGLQKLDSAVVQSPSSVRQPNKVVLQHDKGLPTRDSAVVPRGSSVMQPKTAVLRLTSKGLFTPVVQSSSATTQCPQCYKLCASHDELTSHMDLMHGNRTCQICKICGILLSSAAAMKTHVSNVHEKPGLRRHVCNVCGKRFKTANIVTEHIQIVHKKKKCYKCNYCVKTFFRRLAFQNHLYIHKHGEKSCVCPVCQARYDYPTALKAHIKYVHDDQEVTLPSFKMPSVRGFTVDVTEAGDNVTMETEGSRGKKHTGDKDAAKQGTGQIHHVKEHQETEQSKWSHSRKRESVEKRTCAICSKVYCDAYTMRKHVLFVHQGLRAFKCDQCTSTFKHRAHLLDHVSAKHANNPRFQCPYCDKKFGWRAQYQNHIFRHENGSNSVVCPACSAKFHLPGQLREHLRRKHKGENVPMPRFNMVAARLHDRKLFTCRVCGKHFFDHTSFKKHVYVHEHGYKTLICPKCGEKFDTPWQLDVHLSSAHYRRKNELSVLDYLDTEYYCDKYVLKCGETVQNPGSYVENLGWCVENPGSYVENPGSCVENTDMYVENPGSCVENPSSHVEGVLGETSDKTYDKPMTKDGNGTGETVTVDVGSVQENVTDDVNAVQVKDCSSVQLLGPQREVSPNPDSDVVATLPDPVVIATLPLEAMAMEAMAMDTLVTPSSKTFTNL